MFHSGVVKEDWLKDKGSVIDKLDVCALYPSTGAYHTGLSMYMSPDMLSSVNLYLQIIIQKNLLSIITIFLIPSTQCVSKLS